jgi:OPA family sugar phosphate sensor protein UhpC-like MFS transporter
MQQVRVSGLELGGLLGSLVAGRISDWYIATSPGGAVGKRIQVVMAYLIGVAAMLLAFKAVPAGSHCVPSFSPSMCSGSQMCLY